MISNISIIYQQEQVCAINSDTLLIQNKSTKTNTAQYHFTCTIFFKKSNSWKQIVGKVTARGMGEAGKG